MSHHAPQVGVPFARNPFLKGLVLAYAAAWIAGGVAPVDRSTWLLENLLVVALVSVLVATHRRFAFSNLSWSLVFLFLMLHVVGSHYTYSAVPLGDALREHLGLARNHYDRVVHLAFGLLLGYPLREIVLRVVHVHGRWSFVLPVLVVLALSSLYEILESWAARLVDPSTGMAFVGAQGDVWDGQKDMSLALAGAVAAMAAAGVWRRRTGQEPYLWGVSRVCRPEAPRAGPGRV